MQATMNSQDGTDPHPSLPSKTMPSSGSFGLDMVNVSFLSQTGDVKSDMPLVISPRWENSTEFLTAWMETNRAWLDEMLLRHGALLVRGFGIETPLDAERAIRSFQPKLNNTYRGTSPRRTLGGSEYVFSAAEAPTRFPIAQHIEMSFLPAPPKQLFFTCLKPSKSAGGETALADFRKVFQDVPVDIKQKMLDKGLRYTRTHKKKGSYFTYDVSDMLGWPELFGTDSKEKVEEICKAEGTPVEWLEDDTFVSVTQSHAFQLHPITNEHVWFNHLQVFHWTTFPAELWFAFCRTREWRLLFQFFFVLIFCVIKYGILGHKMSLHTSYGDGEEISAKEMAQIRKAIHKNMVFSRWQKGDLLMIDNFSTSHGRQPTFDKGRTIAVSWSDPIEKSNAVTSLEPVPRETVYAENPQEKTPESTLTRSNSVLLKDQLSANALNSAIEKHFPAAQDKKDNTALQSLFDHTSAPRQ